jgi:hypothetical protein
LKVQPFHDEPENEITLTAFRLLTMDLLMLFHVMNEGTINVLGNMFQTPLRFISLHPAEHYFELSKPDAERALNIYRTFVKQTEAVVQYLSIARMHEHSTRLEIPKIKHAPTSLAASLEEYLHDKDFEVNRRQYLAEREAKRTGGKSTNGTSKPSSEPKATAPKATTASAPTTAATKPASSVPLIDLFESISDNQQTMQTTAQPQLQQYPQQAGFQQPGFPVSQGTAMGVPQQQQAFSPQYGQGTNPFAQMQQQQPQPQPQQPPQVPAQFTGAGFGGYAPQPFLPQNSSIPSIPQNGASPFPSQPQQLQDIAGMPQTLHGLPTIAEPLQAQQTSTNPFRQSTLSPTGLGPTEPKMLSNPTGLSRSPTNPFARHNTGLQQQAQSPTGMSSSPFSTLQSIQETQSSSPFAPQQQQQQFQSQQQPFMSQQPQQSLQPTPTGTNPFARNTSPSQATPPPQGGLTVHATGSTNPFRQSAFVNQQTGQGWQHGNQGTLGGVSLDQVPTQSVFPRPGQQTGQYMG